MKSIQFIFFIIFLRGGFGEDGDDDDGAMEKHNSRAHTATPRQFSPSVAKTAKECPAIDSPL